jgi:hypothetical protein
MCARCPNAKTYEPTQWFRTIWLLHRLQLSGYPFEADELDLEEWLAIGEMRDALHITEIEAMNAKRK